MSQFRTKLFPWCVIPDAGVGDGTIYPVGVTLDKAMEWYWRVKKWELAVNTVPYGLVTFSDIRFEPTIDPSTTERDLICPLPADLERKAEDAVAVFWNCWFYSDAISLIPTTTANEIRSDGGLYYPQFLLDMSLDVMVGTPTLSTYERFPYAVSTISMNLDGFTIPMYTTDETGFISVDFYPTEWWPYAPASGGLDIFDTATGAQINPLIVTP